MRKVLLYSLIFFFGLAGTANATTPIGWFKFDEGSGSSITDSSSNANTGSLVSNALYSTGTNAKYNTGIDFTGAAGYVDIPHISAFDFGTGDFAFSQWYKTPGNTVSEAIVSKDNGSGNGILLYNKPSGTGQVQVFIGGNNRTIGGIQLSDSAWHFIVLERTSGVVSLYVDLNLIDSWTASGDTDISNNHIYYGLEPSGPNYGVGYLDDARVFASAITLQEQYDMYYTADNDTTPPVRSAGAPSGTFAATTTNKTISLTTDKNATCRYSQNSGTAYSAMTHTFSSTGGTSQSSFVTGLVSNTVYHFYVRCETTDSNPNTSDYDISFTIADDLAKPIVSGVNVTNITQTTATVTWHTDEPTDGKANYGTSASYGSSSSLDTNIRVFHSRDISGLTANTTYHVQGDSSDIHANEGTSTDYTFVTAATANTAEHLYIAEASAGANDGSSCANALVYSFFNSSGNWGAGAGKITAGDTVHLCGTITHGLAVQANGSNGNPITIKWEANAKMSSTTWDSQGTARRAALYASSGSYLIFDGGTNGIIETTDNGTTLTHQDWNETGIFLENGCSDCEVKNLSIGPMYDRTASSTDHDPLSASNPEGLRIMGGSHTKVHDNIIHDCGNCIEYGLGSPYTNDIQIYNNIIYQTSIGLNFGATANSAWIDNVSLHNNEVYDLYKWVGRWGPSNGEQFHNNAFHLFADRPDSSITNFRIYSNYTHGTWVSPSAENNTSDQLNFEVNASSTGGLIYNNIYTVTDTVGQPNNAYLLIGGSGAIAFNNTIVGLGSSRCFNAGPAAKLYNNICTEAANGIFVSNTDRPETGIEFVTKYILTDLTDVDHNIYFKTGASVISGNTFGMGNAVMGDPVQSNSYNNWKTKTGFDSNSQFTDPLLSSFIPSLSSPAIGEGVNMSAYAQEDFAGNPRPSVGAWTIGAYELGSDAVTSSPANFKMIQGILRFVRGSFIIKAH